MVWEQTCSSLLGLSNAHKNKQSASREPEYDDSAGGVQAEYAGKKPKPTEKV